MTEETKPADEAAPEQDQPLPAVDPAEMHARFLGAIADEYNRATPEHRKKMQRNLELAKSRSVASVAGLRNMFPGLGRLQVTKQGMKE